MALNRTINSLGGVVLGLGIASTGHAHDNEAVELKLKRLDAAIERAEAAASKLEAQVGEEAPSLQLRNEQLRDTGCGGAKRLPITSAAPTPASESQTTEPAASNAKSSDTTQATEPSEPSDAKPEAASTAATPQTMAQTAATNEPALDENDRTLKELRRMVGMMQNVLSAYQNSEYSVNLSQDYQVTALENGYRANFPEFTYRLMGVTFDFDGFEFDFVTTDTTGQYQYRSDLGNVIAVTMDEQELGQIRLGTYLGHGQWQADPGYASRNEMQMLDISIELADMPVSIDLGNIQYNLNMDTNEDKSEWQAREGFTLGTTTISGNGVFAQIGGGSYSALSKGNDLAGVIDYYVNTMPAIAKQMDADAAQGTTSEVAALAPAMQMLQEMAKYLDEMKGEFVLESLQIKNEEEGQEFGVERIGMDISGTGSTAEELASGVYAFDIKGFSANQAFLPPKLMPRDFKLSIGMADLPRDFVAQFAQLFKQAAEVEPSQADQVLGQGILGMLMRSQAQMKIDAAYQTPGTVTHFAINSRVQPGSAFGAIGDVQVNVNGMQEVVGFLQASGMANNLPWLPYVLSLTNKADDGSDSLQLNVDAVGKLMLNGQDITAILAPPQQ